MAYQLPKDANILYSFVNAKLRDRYSSLQAFCDDNGVEVEEITEKLAKAGFKYNQDTNQFR